MRWFVILALLLLAGCASEAENQHGHPHGGPILVPYTYSGQGPIRVICTTGMVADLVRNIGGDRVTVVQLMGSGVDPHLYKASPNDVIQISKADLVFYSGLHLEGKMAEMLAAQARRRPAFAVTEYLHPDHVLRDESAYDPHLWFDVSLWSQAAAVVANALAAFDPPYADDYRLREQAYRTRLADLHHWVKDHLAQIPPQQRVLVTAHDAFRYFGRAYNVEVRGIQGVSTESEAGVKHVNDLVDFLVHRRIKAIFVESSVSERNVQALIEGCQAQGHTVSVGGELFSDAPGQDGTPEATYEGMIRHNVRTMVQALR